MGSQKAKREERAALSRGRVEKQKGLDGRDRELDRIRKGDGLDDDSVDSRIIGERAILAINIGENEVTGYELQSSSSNNNNRPITPEHQKDNSTTYRVLASGSTDSARAVDHDSMKDGLMRFRHFDSAPDSIIRGGNLVPEAVNLREINDVLNGGAQSSYRFRLIEGSGSSGAAAASNHGHGSVNFKTAYTREERLQTVRMRAEVEQIVAQPGTPPAMRALAALLLDVTHQLIDEPDVRRDEVERLLVEDPEFRHGYRMKNDPLYYMRWRIEHDPEYRKIVYDNPEHVSRVEASNPHPRAGEDFADEDAELKRRAESLAADVKTLGPQAARVKRFSEGLRASE